MAAESYSSFDSNCNAFFFSVSTAALLTDTTSPLYKKGQFEEGFQFSDSKSAWNRSAKVSTMQALTKSTLIPLVNPLSQAVLSTGKINLDEVNLWSDESIQKNFKSFSPVS